MTSSELRGLLAPAVAARGGNVDLLIVDFSSDRLLYDVALIVTREEMCGKKWDDLRPLLRARLDKVLPQK